MGIPVSPWGSYNRAGDVCLGNGYALDAFVGFILNFQPWSPSELLWHSLVF